MCKQGWKLVILYLRGGFLSKTSKEEKLYEQSIEISNEIFFICNAEVRILKTKKINDFLIKLYKSVTIKI